MGEKIILPLMMILAFCLSSLMPGVIPAGAISHDLQQLSSEETFLLRKAYPYGNRASLDQEYFSMQQISPDVGEQTLSTSSSGLSPAELCGPMNSSWPMKSYNAQRVSRTPYSTADNPGIEKWRFKAVSASGIDSGAAVADDGTIYFGGKDFRVYALYPNGTLKWIYKTGEPIFSVPALAADGTIYIASCDHFLYALRLDGTLKWRFNLQYLSFSSPVLADNETIYICTAEGKLFAVNPNGTSQWCYDAMSGMYGDPGLGDDGTIYVGTWDNYFNAINPNGTLKWRFPTGNHVKGVPSVAPDGTIYFGSWDGYLYALYPNGTMRWCCRVGSGTETTPALAADGTIYVGGDELYAVYPNGTMRWIFNLGTNRHIFTSCPAVAAKGTIYVGVDIGDVDGGEMLAVNPDGTERWRKIISDEWVDSSPAIAADGTVYIGSTGGPSGYLHAFGSIESNTPPDNPIIEGTTHGEPGTDYAYYFTCIDPDNNPVGVTVDWGDGTTYSSGWRASGERIGWGHRWVEEGTYIVKAKTQDVLGLESNWSTMEVIMPLSYEPPHFRFFEWLFERFPNAFPILRYLLAVDLHF